MQLKLLFTNWTKLTALLLIGGALAWALKLFVIISTDGQVIETGAAALFMKIGLLFLLVGSTGIGTRLGYRRARLLQVLAIVLSPAVVFASFMLFGLITGPLFENSTVWYAQQEAPIGVAAIVYFIVGSLLFRHYKTNKP